MEGGIFLVREDLASFLIWKLSLFGIRDRNSRSHRQISAVRYGKIQI